MALVHYVLASLCLLLFAATASATTSCEVVVGNYHYNLLSLKDNDLQATDSYGRTYYYQACGEVRNELCNNADGSASAVCQKSLFPPEHRSLGSQNTAEFGVLPSGRADWGFTVTYSQGHGGRSSVIHFVCDPVEQVKFDFVREYPTNTFVFSLRSTSACHIPWPTPTSSITPTPTPSITPTTSPTPSPSCTPSPSVTPTTTPTPSVTPTTTPTPSVSPSRSPTPSPTSSPSISRSPSITPTISRSSSPTSSISRSPSATPTISRSSSPTPSISRPPSITPSISRSPSSSRTPSPSVTPSQSPMPSPSVTTFPSCIPPPINEPSCCLYYYTPDDTHTVCVQPGRACPTLGGFTFSGSWHVPKCSGCHF